MAPGHCAQGADAVKKLCLLSLVLAAKEREGQTGNVRGGHGASGTGVLVVQCRVGDLGEAALPSQHTAGSPAAEPLSADAGTATFKLVTVTFSVLLTKAWMKSTVSFSSWYTGNHEAPNRGGEQGGV